MRNTDRHQSPVLQRFLARLTDKVGGPIAAYNVAIAVAHPEDEIIGCGATLKRLRGARIVVVTDGIRADGQNALPAPSRSGERWRELLAALDLAGFKQSAVIGLGVPEGRAAGHLVAIARRLAAVFASSGTAIALTHALEGFDPDCDATAFAVHEAALLCRRRGQDVTVIEMPLGAGERRGARKRPAAAKGTDDTIVLSLSLEARATKLGMLACFESAPVSAAIAPGDNERFRVAPDYDFSRPPYRDTMSGDGIGAGKWRDLMATAHRRLNEDTRRRMQ